MRRYTKHISGFGKWASKETWWISLQPTKIKARNRNAIFSTSVKETKSLEKINSELLRQSSQYTLSGDVLQNDHYLPLLSHHLDTILAYQTCLYSPALFSIIMLRGNLYHEENQNSLVLFLHANAIKVWRYACQHLIILTIKLQFDFKKTRSCVWDIVGLEIEIGEEASFYRSGPSKESGKWNRLRFLVHMLGGSLFGLLQARNFPL